MPPHKHTLFLFFNGQKTQFTKDVKTANEYMKRCLTSLVNREIQFKTNKNNFTHLRRDKKKKKKKESVLVEQPQTLLWFSSVIPEGENSTLGIPQEEGKQKSIQRLTHECIQRLYS